MSAHSPGPWRLWADGVPLDASGRAIIVALSDMTAVVRRNEDAALICAPPELLAALVRMMNHRHDCTCDGCHDAARAAIAKATVQP
jgi:hypothetical protein